MKQEVRWEWGASGVTWAQASMWCWIIGTPATGNRGLGTSKDKGLKRVPEGGERSPFQLPASLPRSPLHQPLQPNLPTPFPGLLTLLRASDQDHSFQHDGNCY